MEILHQLTPAEAFLIREAKAASFRDLLKYTLIDLMFKKVLRCEEHEHKAHPNDPARIIHYVGRGLRYDGFRPKPHEWVFLKPFSYQEDLVIMFRHVVKMGYENAGSRRGYLFDKILQSSDLAGYFRGGWLNRWLVSVQLTERGQQVREAINRAVDELERKLPDLIRSDLPAAMEILKKINGNVLLLQSFDFELLKQIDDEFGRSVAQRETGTSSGCTGCFVYHDTYGHDFDSGYDSVDGGGSGCGGMSGCSGCGGCGGCGS
ncbi:hypothetical protein QQ020_07615 [Fulvivirgaceae bacterium BMA12]|uniref:Uncharacterized protein n=1 Tax=Agaribacillus aureus TaxID=3051825 RepID=A0ABT8L2H3_9BACT|nr:hypothetical protein [Fulvivirgaceae bacterium BMA12]